MKQDYVTKAEFSKKLNSISNSNDNITKRLDDLIRSLRKDINTMTSSFEEFVQQTNDTLTSIETQIDRINEKLWPNYFYLEAINSATITVNGLGTGELKYTKTLDDESSWTTESISSGSTFTITLDAGEKCYFVGDITPSNGSVTFVTTDPIACGGNVYYVADKNGQLSKNYQCSKLFYECSGLTNAPELPATTLLTGCYSQMLAKCTSLTVAPELPATTLAPSCYMNLFSGCTSLTVAPELPATTLAQNCYMGLFSSTGLTTAPELPATTLAEACYRNMFALCSSLTTSPELPATTLADECYQMMYWQCTHLTTTTSKLPATTLAENCYYQMYASCSRLTIAPELPATTLADNSYSSMFSGCTQLNYVKCLATDMTATGCTSNWLRGVASTGTFVKDANTTWSSGVDGIPSGWTIEDNV